MNWVSNPCGGVRWRTLPNEMVEIKGKGTPMVQPGTPKFTYLENTWNNWAPEFRQAAREYDVPASWLLAIATQETGLWADDPEEQRTIVSGDAHGSIGIMQPIPSFATAMGWHPDDRYDPLENVRMSAKFAADNVEKYGHDLPSIAASHNAGARRCSPGRNQFNFVTTGDYVGHVIAYNNAAIEYLDVNADSWGTYALVGGAVVGAGLVAWMIATGRIYRDPETGMPWLTLAPA